MKKLFALLLFAGFAFAATFYGAGAYDLALNDSVQFASFNLTLEDLTATQARLGLDLGTGLKQPVLITLGEKTDLLGLEIQLTKTNPAAKQAGVSITSKPQPTPPTFPTFAPTASPTILPTPALFTYANNSGNPAIAFSCIPLAETVINTTKTVVVEKTESGFLTTTTIKVKNKGATGSGDLNVAEALSPGEARFEPRPTKLAAGYAEWVFTLSPGEEKTLMVRVFTSQPPQPNYNPPDITVKPTQKDNSLVLAIIILLIVIILETAYWQRKKIKQWLKRNKLVDDK